MEVIECAAYYTVLGAFDLVLLSWSLLQVITFKAVVSSV